MRSRAIWSREALPHTQIHQSSGGWGPVQIETVTTYQARSMSRIKGGIRLTNESDDYPDNFTITRMASSAARFYGAQLGYEPGGFGSARGVMARLYNAVTTGAVHLFYYLGNLTANDQAIDAWMKHGRSKQRAKPVVEVAAFSSDTALKLDDEVVRYRWGSTFFTVARAFRELFDFDYVSEQMISDGALPHYKILVFAGDQSPKSRFWNGSTVGFAMAVLSYSGRGRGVTRSRWKAIPRSVTAGYEAIPAKDARSCGTAT